jgi:hypothetical protein
MKRTFLMFAAVAAFVALIAGCSTAQQANAQKLAANAQLQIKNACMFVQPVLVNLSVAIPTDPNLKTLMTDNAQFCAAAATLDPSSVPAMINTTVPAMINLVGLLPIDPAMKVSITLGLGVASTALSDFLMVYGQQTATPTVAPAAASAPAAAAPAQ